MKIIWTWTAENSFCRC